MSKITKLNKVLHAEIGKPMDLKIELIKKFDSVTVSIGYNLIGISQKERFVCYYETHTEVDTLLIDTVLDDVSVQTYKGKLVSVKWFIELETEDYSQTLDFIVHPLNYEKVFGK